MAVATPQNHSEFKNMWAVGVLAWFLEPREEMYFDNCESDENGFIYCSLAIVSKVHALRQVPKQLRDSELGPEPPDALSQKGR